MGWSGGTFTRSGGSTNWADDRDASTEIEAGLHDTHDEDLAAGINACLAKDGSNAATSDLDLGSNRITNVADPTADQDAASKLYVDTLRVAGYASPASGTITTTESMETSAVVTIPATWNTYDLECEMTCYVTETTAIAGTPTITWRFREGSGTAGAVIATTSGRMDGTTVGKYRGFALFGYQTGETTTGARTVALTSIASSDSGTMSHSGVRVVVRAYRLT